MDVYDASFFLSTAWIGPFWILMLLYPEDDRTQSAMEGPWFFVGPIVIWFAVTLSDPTALSDLFGDMMSSQPLEALATLLGTKAGASAAWAHMVAGDIFVTRWIWKRSLQMGVDPWIRTSSIFFAVMLMPVGIAMHIALARNTESNA